MKTYLLPPTGNFYKANLHAHTDMSDGTNSPEEVKEERRNRLFVLQERVMDEFSAQLIGRKLKILCCGYDESGRQYGRSYMDSVDVDGVVYFDDESVEEGEFVMVEIVDAVASELYGEVVSSQEA